MRASYETIDNEFRTNVTFHSVAGPERIISDGLFSVIIFIYVTVTFSYTFYAFCYHKIETEEEKRNHLGKCRNYDEEEA